MSPPRFAPTGILLLSLLGKGEGGRCRGFRKIRGIRRNTSYDVRIVDFGFWIDCLVDFLK